MKIKISEATPLQLNYLVAKCEWNREEGDWHGTYNADYIGDWSQGGPIIERERIELIPPKNESDLDWMAVWLNSEDVEAGIQNGPTPLIAAMRCYVASKLGNEVEIPDELI